MSTEVRAKIAERLRRLMQMTVDNGCSEAEAIVAAGKANGLMAEYGLSYADVAEVRADRYGVRRRPFSGGSAARRTHHEVSRCHGTIAKFCDCKAWYAGTDLIFFGAETDTETAFYLQDIIRMAMDRECARYLASGERPKGLHGNSLRASFLAGMATRVNQRLREMLAVRQADMAKVARAGAGTALVVLEKQAVVTERYAQHMAATGLKLKRSTSRHTLRSRDAIQAGMSAGDRVALSAGLNGRSGGMIGKE